MLLIYPFCIFHMYPKIQFNLFKYKLSIAEYSVVFILLKIEIYIKYCKII